MPDFPYDIAELAAILLECLLLGVFLPLALASFHTLYTGMLFARPPVRAVLVTATGLMVCLGIAHVAVDAHRAVTAFTKFEGTARTKYLDDVTLNSYSARNAIYVTTSLLGDSVVVWRCYAVYSSFLPALLPTLLALASGICGYRAVDVALHLPPGAIVTDGSLSKWIHALISLSLASNALSTLLIAGKLYHIHRVARKFKLHDDSVRRVCAVVAESGMLNAVTLIAYQAVLSAGSNAFRIFGNIIVPIIGITYTLVIVRIGRYSASQRAEISVTSTRAGRGTSTRPSRPKHSEVRSSMKFVSDVETMHELRSMQATPIQSIPETLRSGSSPGTGNGSRPGSSKGKDEDVEVDSPV